MKGNSGLPSPRFLARSASILLFLLVCGSALTVPAAAETITPARENPFAASRLIAGSDKVREGETIAFTLLVNAAVLEAPRRITVTFFIPDPTMLAAAPASMRFSDDYRRDLTWEGEIAPGQELTFPITLVTMPDSAGNRLLLADAAIFWRPPDREWEAQSHWLQSETEIHAKLTPILFVLPNGMEIGKVELVLLGYLVGGPLLILLIPWLILRRQQQHRSAGPPPATGERLLEKYLLFAMTFAFVFTLGILHLLCAVALEDMRRFVAYEKTSCTLLDKRIILEESTSSSRGGGPRGVSTTTDYNKPLVAVRYPAGGRETIAAGPPRPTAMLSPLAKYALRELAQYNRGNTYPCWYDPKQPETFVLARGISWGWYLLGAGPMFLLYFLGRTLWRRMTA